MRKEKYDITKEDLIKYINLNMGYKEIANIYNCSPNTISRKLKKYNLHTQGYKNEGKRIKDLVGQKFGRLKVLKMNENRSNDGHIMWDCICSCGNEDLKTIISHDLISGKTKSCGCLNKELKTKHGMYDTRLYRIFKGMQDRCYNPNRQEFKYYGGRGIIICEEWLNEQNGFINFYNWAMENGYSDDLEIDREDTNGNYEPNNCRWVNHIIQMNNTRRNIYLKHNNKIKSVAQWSKETGIPENTIRYRMSKSENSNQILKQEAWV